MIRKIFPMALLVILSLPTRVNADIAVAQEFLANKSSFSGTPNKRALVSLFSYLAFEGAVLSFDHPTNLNQKEVVEAQALLKTIFPREGFFETLSKVIPQANQVEDLKLKVEKHLQQTNKLNKDYMYYIALRELAVPSLSFLLQLMDIEETYDRAFKGFELVLTGLEKVGGRLPRGEKFKDTLFALWSKTRDAKLIYAIFRVWKLLPSEPMVDLQISFYSAPFRSNLAGNMGELIEHLYQGREQGEIADSKDYEEVWRDLFSLGRVDFNLLDYFISKSDNPEIAKKIINLYIRNIERLSHQIVNSVHESVFANELVKYSSNYFRIFMGDAPGDPERAISGVDLLLKLAIERAELFNREDYFRLQVFFGLQKSKRNQSFGLSEYNPSLVSYRETFDVLQANGFVLLQAQKTQFSLRKCRSAFLFK